MRNGRWPCRGPSTPTVRRLAFTNPVARTRQHPNGTIAALDKHILRGPVFRREWRYRKGPKSLASIRGYHSVGATRRGRIVDERLQAFGGKVESIPLVDERQIRFLRPQVHRQQPLAFIPNDGLVHKHAVGDPAWGRPVGAHRSWL